VFPFGTLLRQHFWNLRRKQFTSAIQTLRLLRGTFCKRRLAHQQMHKESQHAGMSKVPPQEKAASGSKAADRRCALRHALHARAIFAWNDASGQRRESRGHTRDVGQRGAFVVTEQCPPLGASVSLSIFLPVIGPETRVMRMEAESQVLRSEAISGNSNGVPSGSGFAVSHERVHLFSS
jgi:hypothetical protein